MEKIKFHDPTIIQGTDGSFYCYSTDTNKKGVMRSRSEDLVHWSLIEPALPTKIPEVMHHLNQHFFWAPEIVKVGDTYRLYFCASHFGTTQSMIGLATGKALDGPFTFAGEVIRTYHNPHKQDPNAIDPNFITDREGKPYLVYGSFFGGIYLMPLNADGFFSEDGYGTCIAGGGHTAIEGAFVHYQPQMDKFILFVSYGNLRYDYNIRVGYADNAEGPYLDSQGHNLTELDPVCSVGDKVAGGYNFDLPQEIGYMAPGHNSIFSFEGKDYVVHHIREEGVVEHSDMHLRRIYYINNKVCLSPAPFSGTEVRIPEQARYADAAFSFIRHDRFNNGVLYGRKLKLSAVLEGTLPDGQLRLNLYGKTYTGQLFLQDSVLYFTGVDETGECIWAKEAK